VWGWLIGPFVDAWLKVHPDDVSASARVLDGLVPHLDEACIGSISEVFDATQPFHAARLHRAGVERCRGVARVGQARTFLA
jgi:glycogen debranching enzyme